MEKNNEKKYPRESAGKRMILNVPLCDPRDKVSKVKKKIFSRASELETINYVYVVKDKILVGVFSLKEIFKRKEDELVEDFMYRKVVKVRPSTDQERVAILSIKHNLKAIPVVNKDNEFLGVIPSDTILNILREEHIEDTFLSAGLHKKDGFSSKIIEASVGTLVRIKLPWLIIGLFGGVLAAQITIFFETPLKSHFILATFIPLIVYMADAVGSQTQTIFIRNLMVDGFSQKKYFLKEIKVGILVALVLSLLIFVISLMLFRDSLIGFIIGISLFLTILTSIVISIFIPQILSKTGKDPALGSGPFGTIIADISSLIIYFTTAIFLLNFFNG